MYGNKTNLGYTAITEATSTLISTSTGDVNATVIPTYGYKTALVTNHYTSATTTGIGVYADISCNCGVTYGQVATLNYYAITTAANTRSRAYALTSLGTHLRIRYRMNNPTTATLIASSHVMLKRD